MVSSVVLRRATASSSLFAKFLNPVRVDSLAPLVSGARSFNTDAEVSRSVGVDRRGSGFFPDVHDSFSLPRRLSQAVNQFIENSFLSVCRGMGVDLGSWWNANEDYDALYLMPNMPGLDREGVNVLMEQNILFFKGEGGNEVHSGATFGKKGKLKISENRNMEDHKRRLLAAKYEVKRKLYKALCTDPNLPSEVRDKHRYELSKLPRNSSFTRVRNRCIFTGRGRAVYEFCRMSRLVFRELASQGSLTGIKKASW